VGGYDEKEANDYEDLDLDYQTKIQIRMQDVSYLILFQQTDLILKLCFQAAAVTGHCLAMFVAISDLTCSSVHLW
jgi:hypothetical protein